MTEAVRTIAWFLGALSFLCLLVALVRWAKTHRRAAPLLGGVLVLLLGAGLAPEPPQTRIEQAKDDEEKKGDESSAPPPPAA